MDVSRVAKLVAAYRCFSVSSGLTFTHEQAGGGWNKFSGNDTRRLVSRVSGYVRLEAIDSRSSLFSSSGRGSPRTFPSVRASAIQRLVIRLNSSIFSFPPSFLLLLLRPIELRLLSFSGRFTPLLSASSSSSFLLNALSTACLVIIIDE